MKFETPESKTSDFSKKSNFWKDESGFVLIEVAIAMIIFGLIFGPGFVLWHTHNTVRKHQLTLQHQKLIFQSLAQYLQLNGCLPCPSALDSPVWGEALRPSDSSAAKPGVVPYRTLGLPMRVAKDGFGYWMTYAVDVNCTHRSEQYQSTLCENFFTKNHSALDVIEAGKSMRESFKDRGNIFTPVKDIHNKPINPERFNGIAVILVSHGNNGWGAPLSTGKRIPFPSSASKEIRLNGDDSLTFWASDQTCDTKAQNRGIIAWKTRSQITGEAHISCMDYFFRKEPAKVMNQLPNGPSGFHSNTHVPNAKNNTGLNAREPVSIIRAQQNPGGIK